LRQTLRHKSAKREAGKERAPGRTAHRATESRLFAQQINDALHVIKKILAKPVGRGLLE